MLSEGFYEGSKHPRLTHATLSFAWRVSQDNEILASSSSVWPAANEVAILSSEHRGSSISAGYGPQNSRLSRSNVLRSIAVLVDTSILTLAMTQDRCVGRGSRELVHAGGLAEACVRWLGARLFGLAWSV